MWFPHGRHIPARLACREIHSATESEGSRHSAKAPGWSLKCETLRGEHPARWLEHSTQAGHGKNQHLLGYFTLVWMKAAFFFFGLSKDQGGLSKGLSGKEFPANAGDVGLIPGL